VTAKLMNLKGLRLISPAAASRVHAVGTAPQAAGRQLNTEAVLIGSVRTAGGKKIRVNAQLIRTDDGRILWADGGLEIEARDLLEAERVLATAIALRLRGALTSRERKEIVSTATANAEAHELFVRGKMAQRERPRQRGLAVAQELFEQAVRLDPQYAEALAWLAMVQADRFTTGSAGDAARLASIENARRALAINPSIAMARSARITIFHTTGQAEEGLREAATLRNYGPVDATALSAIATAYVRAGMPDRAVPFFQQALEMDPEDTHTLEELSFAAYWAGQYELGMRVLKGQPAQVAPLPRMNLALSTGHREMARSAAIQLMQDPDRDRHSMFGAMCLRNLGEGDLAVRILRERLPDVQRKSERLRSERVVISVGLGYAILGNKQSALDQVRLALEIDPGNPWTLYFAAEIYARVGEERQAIEYLRQSIDAGFLLRQWLDWPHFRLFELRERPEIRALRDQLTAKIAVLRNQY
jgi:tetratricopeptide (TPR) repeat protein